MEPILTIKGIELGDSIKDQAQVEDFLRRVLLTQGAAYDHIGFSWVQTGKTWTLYGYGWWNCDER